MSQWFYPICVYMFAAILFVNNHTIDMSNVYIVNTLGHTGIQIYRFSLEYNFA